MDQSFFASDMTLITLVAGAVILALVFVAGAFAARVTSVSSGEQRSVRPSGSAGIGKYFGVAATIGAVIFACLIFSYRKAEVTEHRRAESHRQMDVLESEIAEQHARTREQEGQDEITSEGASPEASTATTEESASAGRPRWTQNPLTVLATGKVEEALLVAQSDLCATAEEAREEATVRAVAALQDRIGIDWPELDSWSIPVDEFQSAAIRESFSETEMHEFAGRDEPMYRVFLQIEDSAAVREKLLDRWRMDVASVRAHQLALGLGGLGIGLGLISAFVRGLLAVSGRRQKTIVAAVTALAVLGGLGFLFVA